MKKDPNPSVGVAPADAPAAVPRRRFGRTGLRLPVLSAGFMRAMQSWQDVADEQIDPSQETMLAVANEALRLGIDQFRDGPGLRLVRAPARPGARAGGARPRHPADQGAALRRPGTVQCRGAGQPAPAAGRAGRPARPARCQRPPGAVVRLPARRLPGRGPAAAGPWPGRLDRFLRPRPDRGAPGRGPPPRRRRFRLCQPALVRHLPAPHRGTRAGGGPRPGRVHHQPHGQGRQAPPSAPPAGQVVRAALTHAVQRPRVPAAAGGDDDQCGRQPALRFPRPSRRAHPSRSA